MMIPVAINGGVPLYEGYLNIRYPGTPKSCDWPFSRFSPWKSGHQFLGNSMAWTSKHWSNHWKGIAMDMSDMCFWKWIPGGFSGPILFGGCLRRVKVVSYCMMPTSCHCMVPLHRASRASLNHRPINKAAASREDWQGGTTLGRCGFEIWRSTPSTPW